MTNGIVPSVPRSPMAGRARPVHHHRHYKSGKVADVNKEIKRVPVPTKPRLPIRTAPTPISKPAPIIRLPERKDDDQYKTYLQDGGTVVFGEPFGRPKKESALTCPVCQEYMFPMGIKGTQEFTATPYFSKACPKCYHNLKVDDSVLILGMDMKQNDRVRQRIIVPLDKMTEILNFQGMQMARKNRIFGIAESDFVKIGARLLESDVKDTEKRLKEFEERTQNVTVSDFMRVLTYHDIHKSKHFRFMGADWNLEYAKLIAKGMMSNDKIGAQTILSPQPMKPGEVSKMFNSFNLDKMAQNSIDADKEQKEMLARMVESDEDIRDMLLKDDASAPEWAKAHLEELREKLKGMGVVKKKTRAEFIAEIDDAIRQNEQTFEQVKYMKDSADEAERNMYIKLQSDMKKANEDLEKAKREIQSGI